MTDYFSFLILSLTGGKTLVKKIVTKVVLKLSRLILPLNIIYLKAPDRLLHATVFFFIIINNYVDAKFNSFYHGKLF